MITSFGKILRKIRIDNNEILKDMAEKLGVTSSFLSAVENGKKKIPDGWLNTIFTSYNLTIVQKKELEFAYSETNDSLKISFDGLAPENKELAFSFARKLNNFDSKDIEQLKTLLERIEE
ncbi:helix-turn-helix transcriptional regulator [Chakrabartyella piscis]|uniref:helix-turn-helix domain-containing protein n=1 Tax=Chakrabartyella piscis TaxID=2918914 RepID=UPI002958345F|nr:helix-turn-helix transcriptional regulator [Chakrabartyella piscis]